MNTVNQYRVYDTLSKQCFTAQSPGQHHITISLNGTVYNLQNGSGGSEYESDFIVGHGKNGVALYHNDIVLVHPLQHYGVIHYRIENGLRTPKIIDVFSGNPIDIQPEYELELVGNTYTGIN